jgi:hypothetical protein
MIVEEQARTRVLNFSGQWGEPVTWTIWPSITCLAGAGPRPCAKATGPEEALCIIEIDGLGNHVPSVTGVLHTSSTT